MNNVAYRETHVIDKSCLVKGGYKYGKLNGLAFGDRQNLKSDFLSQVQASQSALLEYCKSSFQF